MRAMTTHIYNLENFIELAKFTLRNNYAASFNEYLRYQSFD